MNKQRKVVITTTYNEMGIIIDTKVEEVAQPNLQPSCNHLATDTISRQAAIDVADAVWSVTGDKNVAKVWDQIKDLPSAQPEIIRCEDCKYWMREYLSISGKHGCNVMRDYTAPDDYCFKAER